MKKRFFWVVGLTFLFFFMINIGHSSAEGSIDYKSDYKDYTLGEVEKTLLDYLHSKGKNYEVGSQEYTDFIFDQYQNDTDKELASREDYHDAINTYMDEYTYQYSLMETGKLDEKISDSVSLFGNTKASDSAIQPYFDLGVAKEKTVGKLQEEINQEIEKQEQSAIEFQKLNPIQITAGYSVSSAKAYAESWYNGRNPAFNSYTNDCTNFVSQILFAGGMKMDGSWYSNYNGTSNSWKLVVDLYNYWSPKKQTHSSWSKTTIIQQSKAGDVIQFRKTDGTRYSHAMFVYEKSNGTIYLSGHTNDYLKRNFKNIDATAYEMYRVIKM